MRTLKLKYWTARLRKHWLAYNRIANEYSCGIALAEHISGRLRDEKDEVNIAIRAIRVLNPSAELHELV